MKTENSICECGHEHKKHFLSRIHKEWICILAACPCKKFTPQKKLQSTAIEQDAHSQDEQARSRKVDSTSLSGVTARALKSKSNKRDGSPDALRGNHSPMPPIVQKEYNRLLKKHPGNTPQTKQDVLIREWFKGFKDGESSVLEFLEDMKGLGFKEEYNSWAQADEYTKLNGEVVKRYE